MRFALSWDQPTARFGSGMALSKYYSQFFGERTGLHSAQIAAYSLLHYPDWEKRIEAWQQPILQNPDLPDFYKHQLFNELYYLVEGGSLWLDSSSGVENARDSSVVRSGGSMHLDVIETMQRKDLQHVDLGEGEGEGGGERHIETPGAAMSDSLTQWGALVKTYCFGQTGSSRDATAPLNPSDSSMPSTSRGRAVAPEPAPTHLSAPTSGSYAKVSTSPSPHSSIHTDSLASDLSASMAHPLPASSTLHAHDERCRGCRGDQSQVGQFLLYEGMEYLMYNTQDVNFTASFALLALWPQLELSCAKDVVRCVAVEDRSVVTSLGEGQLMQRKVMDTVPHDVGSPSEAPWDRPNSYCFQDTSKWKDLGPKFVLQNYRNFVVLGKDLKFLREMYPTMLKIMEKTAAFDRDGDDMIENDGIPDQTYDIWKAEGVSCYTGGLWCAALEATAGAAIAIGDTNTAAQYSQRGVRARDVLVRQLWNPNGYLNYDSSYSLWSDSIMADMLAGSFYSIVCELRPVIPLAMAVSCIDTIFIHNVLGFGGGKWLGAVNGARLLGSNAKGVFKTDRSCIQSKEVWCGTTYTLAATMIALSEDPELSALEDTYTATTTSTTGNGSNGGDAKGEEVDHYYGRSGNGDSNRLMHSVVGNGGPVKTKGPWKRVVLAYRQGLVNTPIGFDLLALLEKPLSKRLRDMAFFTARGVHDGGWETFGYHFNTPEGYEKNGNYRSLGYSRALAIWSIEHMLNRRYK